MLSFGMIDKSDVTGNIIRREMSAATGTNSGQRESYSSMSINGTSYLPFSFQALHELEIAKNWEGLWQGTIMHPPPTTSVIKINP